MVTMPVDKSDMPMSGHLFTGRDDGGTTLALHLELLGKAERALAFQGHSTTQADRAACVACHTRGEICDELAKWEVKRRESEGG
jgi:hypothetical protein